MQHDYVIDDQAGLSFLADLNSVLQAIVTCNSGATAPSTTYAYMFWADTSAGKLKQRNAANNAWVIICDLLAPLATVTYVDALLDAQDALRYTGALDCSSNPNYPAADAGDVYRVSVAGKIGGASGADVEAGDVLICFTDGSASGTHAGVGANWLIIQKNLVRAVTGPAVSVSGNIPSFNGTGGTEIQDSGKAFSTDGTLSANSDDKIPTEQAVKEYVDGLVVPVTTMIGVVKAGHINVPQNSTVFASALGRGAGYTEAQSRHRPSHPITLSELRVDLSANCPSGQSIQVIVRKNGVDTALAVTINTVTDTGSDLVNTIDVDPKDNYAFKVVTSATFGSTNDVKISCRAKIRDTSLGAPVGFNFNAIGAGALNALWGDPGGYNLVSLPHGEVPVGKCVLTKFALKEVSAATDGQIFKNAVAHSKQLANTDENDLEEMAYAAGDLYVVRAASANATAAGYVKAVRTVENHNSTYCPIFFSSPSQAQATTRYAGGYLSDASATETDVSFCPPAGTYRNLRVCADSAPAASQTIVVTVRKDGVDTALTCTITDAGRTASDLSNTVTFTGTEEISVKVVHSALTGTRSVNICLEPFA